MCLSVLWLKRHRLQVTREEGNSILVKPMFFHKPSMTSTHNATERIATPLLNRTWTMINYGIFHRCTYRTEKQVPTDHKFITPSEKTQCPVHLTSEKVQRNLPQCSHTKESRVNKHFATEKAFSSEHQSVQGKGETFFRFSDPAEAARLVLEELRDHFLAEAKSEILKQECKVDTLNITLSRRTQSLDF